MTLARLIAETVATPKELVKRIRAFEHVVLPHPHLQIPIASYAGAVFPIMRVLYAIFPPRCIDIYVDLITGCPRL